MIYVNINSMRRMSRARKNSVVGPSKGKSRNRSEKLVNNATELFDSIKSKQKSKLPGTKQKRKKTEKVTKTTELLDISSNPIILDKILGYLTPPDIKNMSVLSQFWRSTMEKAKFWKWAVVRPNPEDYQNMLASNRIKIIGSIDLQQIGGGEGGYNEDLAFILNFLARNIFIMKLTELNLSCTDLSTFCPHTLFFIISRLRRVNMFGTDLRTGQLTVLFSKIHGCRDLKLKRLDIGYNKLSNMSCEILTQGVLRLEEVNIQNTHLTAEQISYFLEEIRVTRDLKMKNLMIGGHDLSSVDPDILSEVFCKLRHLQLWGFYLSKDQLNFIFDHMRLTKTLKLRHLGIHHIKLSSASRYCLAFAICKIKEVHLINSHLVTEQLNTIFHTIANCKNLHLRHLILSGSDFSLVNPDILSDAVCKLEEVELVGKNLTDYQLESSLFQILKCTSLKLRKFIVFHNNKKLTILPQNSSQVESILEEIEF